MSNYYFNFLKIKFMNALLKIIYTNEFITFITFATISLVFFMLRLDIAKSEKAAEKLKEQTD